MEARTSEARDPRKGELERLMASYAQGDEAAFADLYRHAAPPLRAAVRRWTRDPEQAEDVVQATFLKLFRARASYALGEPVLPWLYVIAKRTLLDEQRRLRDRYEVLTNEGTLPSDPEHVSLEQAELEMRDALVQLPAPYRDAIALTRLFGFSGSEAADLLDTTKAAIKQRVHRGYTILRAWFDGNVAAPTG